MNKKQARVVGTIAVVLLVIAIAVVLAGACVMAYGIVTGESIFPLASQIWIGDSPEELELIDKLERSWNE